MAASLTDVVTAGQNAVQALNTIASALSTLAGKAAAKNVSTATVVKTGTGRLVSVSITTGGSATGYIYDGTIATSTSNPVFAIPNTIGIIQIGIPLLYGLVVAPGSGQVVTVVYS